MPHERLTIVTLNVFATPFNNAGERYKQQVASLKQLSPDAVFLQEMYASDLKSLYEENFSDTYHVFSTGSLASLKPTFIAGALNFKISMLLLFFMSKMVALIELEPLSLVLLSLVLSVSNSLPLRIPSLVYLALSWKFPRLRDILEGDTLGLMLLVKKSTMVVKPDSLTTHLFSNQAYTFSFVGLFEWCFKPRGFISVQAQHIQSSCTMTLVNTHLNVGLGNSKRLLQVKELADCMHQLSISKEVPVVVGGDTNADAKDPEIKFLYDQGFCDTYLTYYKGDLSNAPRHGDTWDNSNPLAHGFLIEPNQRVDYIMFKNCHSSKGFLVEKSMLLFDQEPFVSDHYGVLSQLLVAM